MHLIDPPVNSNKEGFKLQQNKYITENEIVKESIYEALITLLSEKEYSQITITEITHKAGV